MHLFVKFLNKKFRIEKHCVYWPHFFSGYLLCFAKAFCLFVFFHSQRSQGSDFFYPVITPILPRKRSHKDGGIYPKSEQPVAS